MQRFELSDGTSNKFWEVETNGSDLTVTFGRIGTAGQSKTKTFADAEAASRERDKLIKEKTGKGYGAVGGLAILTSVNVEVPKSKLGSMPTAAPAAIAPVSDPTSAPTAITLQVEQPKPASNATKIVWPTGGFQWTPALRKMLPVLRGVHVPPISHTLADESSSMGLVPQPQREFILSLSGAMGRRWVSWDAQLLAASVAKERLIQADPEFWLELQAQLLCTACSDISQQQLYEVTKSGIEFHGVDLILNAVLVVWDACKRFDFESDQDVSQAWRTVHLIENLLYPLLRQAVARADAPAYEAALLCVHEMRSRSDDHKFMCCMLFPHIVEWAVECVQLYPLKSRDMLGCALPFETVMEIYSDMPWLVSDSQETLLQIHAQGERAFEFLSMAIRPTGNNSPGDCLHLLARMYMPQMIPRLVELIDDKEVRVALDKLADEFPAAVLKSAIECKLAGKPGVIQDWLVRLAMRHRDALPAALAALDEPARSAFEGLLAPFDFEEADPATAPDFLLSPCWKQARRQESPTLELTPITTEDRIEWSQDTREEFAQFKPDNSHVAYLLSRPKAPGELEDRLLDKLSIVLSARERVLQGLPLQPGDLFDYQSGCATPELLFYLPPHVALAIWNSIAWHHRGDYTEPICALLARHGIDALPGLVSYVSTDLENGFAIAIKVDSAMLVPAALRALHSAKRGRREATAWIRAHPRTVASAALPMAFGTDKVLREAARTGLYWLQENDFAKVVAEAAAAYGAHVSEALLGLDPMQNFPTRMPKLPAFFVPAAFHRPLLNEGGALPMAAIETIGIMLAISSIDTPYAGLIQVRKVCTPASLAAFAWDLFTAWMQSGAPSKESWAFTALGLLGDDETARRLTPKIREWPGQSAHARAVVGLDLLAAIGSDVALMHLNGIACKSKFKPLQERAKEKIAAVADARGFTADQLADRIVPDLDLDDDGTLVLDFGPRQFHVGFDETLKPFVKDGQDVRLKDLPKPLKTDDAVLTEAAVARYKLLKKDAKAVAGIQITRLEMAMVEQRRWSAIEFRQFFLQPPLLRHLSARIVWGVYSDDALLSNFRIAEDWTLADQDDALYALPDDAFVGISHVLEMPWSALNAFGQIFADYKILQPFKQLGRETYALAEAECDAKSLDRFAQKSVSAGSVMGLLNRGWQRGEAESGWVDTLHKRIDKDKQVELALDPGISVEELSKEEQKLPSLTLRKRGKSDSRGEMTFSSLEAIVLSELLRDIELLV